MKDRDQWHPKQCNDVWKRVVSQVEGKSLHCHTYEGGREGLGKDNDLQLNTL